MAVTDLHIEHFRREGIHTLPADTHIRTSPDTISFAQVEDSVIIGMSHQIASPASILLHIRKLAENETAFGHSRGLLWQYPPVSQVIKGYLAALALQDPAGRRFGSPHAESLVIVKIGDGRVPVMIPSADNEIFVPALVKPPHVRPDNPVNPGIIF